MDSINTTPEPIMLLEESIGGKFQDVRFGNNFLSITPKPRSITTKIDKKDYAKIRDI